MAALMDELACLTRDLLIIKTAPQEGISMLSGVATEKEIFALAQVLSIGELTRIMSELQQTAAGFTNSTNRRMDAELCLVKLCQPELSMDSEALNARLTRIEEQLRSGCFTAISAPVEPAQKAVPVEAPVPTKPEQPASIPEKSEAPIGFWTDMVSQVRKELKQPLSGFFSSAEDAPIRGVLRGDKLLLVCESFAVVYVDTPDVLSLLSRKASAILGRPIQAVAVDKSSRNTTSGQMDQLLSFGRAHSDRINIKNEN